MKKEKPRYRKKSLVSRVKKYVSGAALGLGILLGSSNSHAEPPSWRTSHATPYYRAMGKAGDLTSDPRIPANANLQKSKRDITFNFRTNPEKIKDTPGELSDLLDFEYLRDKDKHILERLVELIDKVNEFDVDIDLDMRLEAYGTFGDLSFGKFVVGTYGEFAYTMQMGGIDGLSIHDLKFEGDDLTKPYLDIGEDKTVVDIRAITRSGVYFGYGKRFKIKKSYLAVGIRATAAHIIYKPIARVRFNDTIRGISDIDTDKDSKVEGGGLLLDAHTTAILKDSLFNTRLGFGLTNFGAIWYHDGTEDALAPGVAVGLAIHPLHALKHDNLLVAFDVENIGTDDTEIQAGMSYRLAYRTFAITPKIGVIVNERNLLTGVPQDIITAGGSIDIGTLQLNGIVEYNTTKNGALYNFSIGGRF